jgi:hypothetical protein
MTALADSPCEEDNLALAMLHNAAVLADPGEKSYRIE